MIVTKQERAEVSYKVARRYVSSCKKELLVSEDVIGIPVIIANGFMCDGNGEPFKNIGLQSHYEPVSKTANNCKMILYGKLVQKDQQMMTDSYYDMDFASSINIETGYSTKLISKSKLVIERMDSLIAREWKLSDRQKSAKAILAGATNKTPGLDVSMVNEIEITSEEVFDDFIEKCAQKQVMAIIRGNELKKELLVNQFSYTQAEIVDVNTFIYKRYKSDKELLGVSDFKIKIDDKKYMLSAMRMPQKQIDSIMKYRELKKLSNIMVKVFKNNDTTIIFSV